MADKRISELTLGTPINTDFIPYVDVGANETKKAYKSDLKGDKGDAATVDVGTTSTGLPGTDAAVTNSGTINDAVLDFVIPRGDKGANGLDITWKGTYSGATTYVLNDAVAYNGSSYICIGTTTGNLPTDGTYWNLMAQKGTDGVGGDMLKSVYDPTNKNIDAFDLKNQSGDYTNFNTNVSNPTYQEGRIFYDSTKKAVSYYNDEANVTVNLGQENIIRVKNITGSTILNGSVVYPTGSDGTNITIGLANAHDKEKCRLIGLTTHSIEDGAIGYVTKFGEVGGLNTSAFTVGDTVYLSNTDGQFTKTKPTGASFITQIGMVKVVSATVGVIMVDISTTELTVELTQDVGFSPNDTATISFVDGTRTLTLTPTGTEYDFYQYGDKYTKTTDSFQISATEGTHVIYYNMGTLTEIVNPTNGQYDVLIRNNPLVATIYRDATNNKSQFIGKEDHKIGSLSGDIHSYLHFNFGARYSSGLALTDIISEASGNLATSAQFGVASGAIVDEDLYLPFPGVASTVGLPVYYYSGTTSAPTLRSATNAGYSVLTTGTGRLAFNQLSGSNYVLTEASDTNFVLYHIVANNENTASKRVIAIMGRNQYTSTALAIAGINAEVQSLLVTGIFAPEVKVIGTVVFETRTAYTNAVKARIKRISAGVNYQDLRTTYFNGTSVGSSGGGTGSTSFNDSLFEIYDDGDATKKIKFEASSIATGQTRTITMPDKNVNLGAIPETDITFTDITTGNVSTTKHGYTPKLPGNTTTFLRGDGMFATPAGGGDVSSNTATSVDGEIALFNSTTGKQIKRATGTGIAKITSGVLGTATAGTDYVAPNGAITGATKTKVTYDAKGLVTAGTDATTADIAASTNKRYVTDANLTVIGNTSGTNTGDETVSTIKTKLGITTLSGSNTGDQTITLTGPVTGSGTGSFATTITDKAVTLAKMNDVATSTVFYRKTAGTGVPEVQTLATLKTDLGLTGTNSGDQTSIVGITGTLAQFNTAISDADITPTTRNITVNGTTQNLSADRTFTVTDANLSTSDVTTNNASATKHGFLPKLDNTGTKYLRDDGTWQTVSVGGGAAFYETNLDGQIYTGTIAQFVVTASQTIAGVYASLLSLPTGSNVTIQVYKNGTASTNSIFTSDTPLSITTTTGATNGVYSVLDTAIDNGSVVAGDVIYIVITAVGSTLPGSNLYCKVY